MTLAWARDLPGFEDVLVDSPLARRATSAWAAQLAKGLCSAADGDVMPGSTTDHPKPQSVELPGSYETAGPDCSHPAWWPQLSPDTPTSPVQQASALHDWCPGASGAVVSGAAPCTSAQEAQTCYGDSCASLTGTPEHSLNSIDLEPSDFLSIDNLYLPGPSQQHPSLAKAQHHPVVTAAPLGHSGPVATSRTIPHLRPRASKTQNGQAAASPEGTDICEGESGGSRQLRGGTRSSLDVQKASVTARNRERQQRFRRRQKVCKGSDNLVFAFRIITVA